MMCTHSLLTHSLAHSLTHTHSLTHYSTFTQGTGKRGTDEFGSCPKRQRKQRKHQMYSNRCILENTCSRRVEYSFLLFYLNARHKHKSRLFSVFSVHTFFLHPYILTYIHICIHIYIYTYIHLSVYLSIYSPNHLPIHPYLTQPPRLFIGQPHSIRHPLPTLTPTPTPITSTCFYCFYYFYYHYPHHSHSHNHQQHLFNLELGSSPNPS